MARRHRYAHGRSKRKRVSSKENQSKRAKARLQADFEAKPLNGTIQCTPRYGDAGERPIETLPFLQPLAFVGVRLHRALLKGPRYESFGRILYASKISHLYVLDLLPVDVAQIRVSQIGAAKIGVI